MAVWWGDKEMKSIDALDLPFRKCFTHFIYERNVNILNFFNEAITYFWNNFRRISSTSGSLIEQTEVKTSNVVSFMWKYSIVNLVK